MTHQHLTNPLQMQGALKVAQAIDKLDDQLIKQEQMLTMLNALCVPLDLESPELLTLALTTLAMTRGILLKFALDMGHAGGEISSEDYAENAAKCVVGLRGLFADLISSAETVTV